MLIPHLLLTLLAVAVLFAGGVLWMRAVARMREGKPILPFEPRQPVPWGFLDLLLLVALYVAAVVAAAAVADSLGVPLTQPVEKQSDDGRVVWLLMQLAIPASSTVIGLTVIAVRNKARGRDLGFQARTVVRDLATGVAAFTMLAPPVFAIQAILSALVPYKHSLITLIKSDPRFLLLSAVAAVMVAPVMEELMFRLLLQGWLEKLAIWRGRPGPLLFGGRLESAAGMKPGDEPYRADVVHGAAGQHDGVADQSGDAQAMPETHQPGANSYAPPMTAAQDAAAKDPAAQDDAGDETGAVTVRALPRSAHWPIVISALIFAVAHPGQGAAPVPLFVLALGLGYLYQQTHRILPSIVVHLLLNGTTMLLLAVEIFFPQK